MGKPVTKDQCAQWYEVFEQVGMKRPAQRANVVHKSIYVPKHTCPVPLHVMLGIVNDIRGMVNNLLQKIDGHNKKDVASKTKKMGQEVGRDWSEHPGTARFTHMQIGGAPCTSIRMGRQE